MRGRDMGVGQRYGPLVVRPQRERKRGSLRFTARQARLDSRTQARCACVRRVCATASRDLAAGVRAPMVSDGRQTAGEPRASTARGVEASVLLCQASLPRVNAAGLSPGLGLLMPHI